MNTDALFLRPSKISVQRNAFQYTNDGVNVRQIARLSKGRVTSLGLLATWSIVVYLSTGGSYRWEYDNEAERESEYEQLMAILSCCGGTGTGSGPTDIGVIEYTCSGADVVWIEFQAENIVTNSASVLNTGLNLIGKKFVLFREGYIQFSDAYTVTTTSNRITPTSPFTDGERLKILITGTI